MPHNEACKFLQRAESSTDVDLRFRLARQAHILFIHANDFFQAARALEVMATSAPPSEALSFLGEAHAIYTSLNMTRNRYAVLAAIFSLRALTDHSPPITELEEALHWARANQDVDLELRLETARVAIVPSASDRDRIRLQLAERYLNVGEPKQACKLLLFAAAGTDSLPADREGWSRTALRLALELENVPFTSTALFCLENALRDGGSIEEAEYYKSLHEAVRRDDPGISALLKKCALEVGL